MLHGAPARDASVCTVTQAWSLCCVTHCSNITKQCKLHATAWHQRTDTWLCLHTTHSLCGLAKVSSQAVTA